MSLSFVEKDGLNVIAQNLGVRGFGIADRLADGERFDVYVNDTLWESFDGYAAAPGTQTVTVTLSEETSHTLAIHNTSDKSAAATGNTLRVQQVAVTGRTRKTQDITYTYDGLNRLAVADYADDSLHYAYLFDVAGNRTQEQVTIGATTTTTNFGYNAAN